MIKIIIADDHTMFADGLDSIISQEKEMEVVGKTTTGEGVFRILKNKTADVLLLDINLLDMSGIDVAKQLNNHHPEVKILAISMYNEESFISEILKQGASGYILKNTNKSELIKAIQTVHEGQTYFSQEVTDTIMNSLLKKQSKKTKTDLHLPKISRREKEVLKLIAKEYTTKEIASQLFISLKTVESHRSSLLAKFDVRNSVGLIKIALQKGFLE